MSVAESRSGSSVQLSASGAGTVAGLRFLLAAIGLLLMLRFVLAATADLSEDEAYYWLWSTHLAAGYYDHPPMIAYWIRGGTAIFGDTAFGVRFVALLSALASTYLLYRASLSLFGDASAALLAALWLNATLLGNAAAIIATPDTPLAFFASLTLFALAKLIETGRGGWWLGVGAALGLAFVSKYTAVLLLPGVFVWMIATAEGRRWFLRPEPYIGALIAAALVAPVFWWNYAHDWASFAKQAQHSVSDRPASALKSMGELLGGQAGLATPLIFAFCVFGSFFALVRGWKRAEARWLMLGGATAPVLLFFLEHSASHKIQANWPGFIYPAALLAGVHAFLTLSRERATSPQRRGSAGACKESGNVDAGDEFAALFPRKRESISHAGTSSYMGPRFRGDDAAANTRGCAQEWAAACFKFAPWVGIAFTLAAFLQLGTGALPIEAGKDPTARLKGWAKLGGDIAALADAQGATAILTDRYAITGELAFYGSKERPTLQINERIRYANLPAPDEGRLKSGPALLVLRSGGDASAAAAFFENSRFLTTVAREAGFRSRDAYDVRLLLGYRGGLFGRETGHSCATRPERGSSCN